MTTQCMWVHAEYMGEPATFLLQDSDGTTLDIATYLDRLCTVLHSSDPLDIKAARAYQSLGVYISLLDDADAEPFDLENEMEVGIDEWTPFHLAIVVKHAEAITELLSFHQQHALHVLEDLLRDNSTEILPEDGIDVKSAAVSTSSTSLDYASNMRDCSSLRGTLQHQQRSMELQVRNELGGAVVILKDCGSGEVCSNRAPQNCRTSSLSSLPGVGGAGYTISCVTRALASLLNCVVYEKDHGVNVDKCGGDSAGGVESASGFVTRIVSAHCGAVAEQCSRFPSLLIDHDVLYEVCSADLGLLSAVLKLFTGLLLPTVNGIRMPYAGSISRASSVHASPSESPQGGALPRGHHQTVPQNPILLSCTMQEHQKLAFLALWISFRETTTMERQPPGSARQNCESTVLSDFRVSSWNFKKVAHMAPINLIWSGHLFVLSRLLSRDCTLEGFLDIVEEGGYASCSTEVPSNFIPLLVAGAVVSALPRRYRLVQMLCKKVKMLLVDVPGVFSPLRFYLASCPTNETERFGELWLAETPLLPQKKFNSRADMMYFSCIESVLLGAEELWSKPDAFSDNNDRSRVQSALQDWLKMCQQFLLSLKEKLPSGHQRRASSKSLHDDETPLTATPFHSTEEHDVDALCRLCNVLPLRLKHGTPPSPAIYAYLYPQEATTATTTTTTVGANENNMVGSNEESAFEAAQFAFANMAGSADNKTKLNFYALYKQATVGDVNVSRPWIVDLVGCAKWDAWNALKGMTTEAAKQKYVADLQELKNAKPAKK